MMNVKIVAVGSVRERYLKDGIAEYAKRISRFAKWEEVEIPEARVSTDPKPAEIEQCLASEGERILAKINRDDAVLVLAVEGKTLRSEDLAAWINAKAVSGLSSLVFVIGGSFGLSDAVKKRGDFLLSFSPMTFPHQLMRLILSEQIYRAFSILNHTAYHK